MLHGAFMHLYITLHSQAEASGWACARQQWGAAAPARAHAAFTAAPSGTAAAARRRLRASQTRAWPWYQPAPAVTGSNQRHARGVTRQWWRGGAHGWHMLQPRCAPTPPSMPHPRGMHPAGLPASPPWADHRQTQRPGGTAIRSGCPAAPARRHPAPARRSRLRRAERLGAGGWEGARSLRRLATHRRQSGAAVGSADAPAGSTEAGSPPTPMPQGLPA